jgi:hypothetical protein
MDILPMTLDGGDDRPYNKFYFPTGSYTIENLDGTVETFTASMTNTERTAEINTEADVVALNVDDTEKVCEASLALDQKESYDIKLLSFADDETSRYITGDATKNDAAVAVSLNGGEYAEMVTGANIAVNGIDENGVWVDASAGTGGSISPSGATRVSKDQELHFDITPDSGYEIADVFVNGESVGAVESYDYLGTEDAAIYATFRKPDNLSVLVEPTRTTYGVGDTFDPTGLELRLQNSDGSARIITEGFSCSADAFTTDGAKTVRVSYDGMTTSFTVNVIDAKIAIKTPSTKTIYYGDTLMLHAEVNPAESNVIWTSSDPSIATVSADGGVTCFKNGKVTITATIDDGDDDASNDISTSIELKCKGGLFWKIISFFKNLFKVARVISEAIDVIKYN